MALVILVMTLIAPRAGAAELYTVDGERIECEWIGATPQAITVAPTGSDQQAREVALSDVDRFELTHVRKAIPRTEPTVLLIDNDGAHPIKTSVKKIKLRAGLHRFVLPYVQGNFAAGLELQISIPGKWNQEIPGPMLWHVPDGEEEPPSPGVDEQGYRLPEDPPTVEAQARYEYRVDERQDGDAYKFTVPQLPELTVSGHGLVSQLGIGVADRPEGYGIVYSGYIKIEEDGEYTFRLVSDDGAQLYLGQTPAFLLGPVDSPNTSEPAQDWQVQLTDGTRCAGSIAVWDESGITLQLSIAA